MSLNWSLVTAQHVAKACEVVGSKGGEKTSRSRGLFVRYKGQDLPAKEVARVAYLLATGQPLGTRLRFASGDATLNLLRRLGCDVERRSSSMSPEDPVG